MTPIRSGGTGLVRALCVASGIVFAVAVGCARAPRTNDPGAARASGHGPSAEPPQVIVLAIDGVRPREVFEGVDVELAARQGLSEIDADASDLMPNLHRLARTRGVLLGGPGDGDSIWATGPNFVSLPGYREVLTGRPAACQRNECGPLEVDTLADDFRAVSASVREVAVISSWEGIEGAAARRPDSIVTSCGRRRGTHLEALRYDAAAAHLVRAGEKAAPAPGGGEFRPDALTAKIALGYLAHERPRFLFLGLGEPDEYAHANDYRGYLASLRAADHVLGRIDEILEKAGAWRRDAIVFVTTDHGRGDDFRNHGAGVPESGRVWLLALGARVGKPAFPPSWKSHHLADIAPTLRLLSGLPSDAQGGTPIASLVGRTSNRPHLSNRDTAPGSAEIF